MKKIILFAICIYVTFILNAQVSKTLNVTSGGLAMALTDEEKNTITELTLTGTIDARDFYVMRDSMPVLAVLDLSDTKITEYYVSVFEQYHQNQIPPFAFWGKSSLTSINLPLNIYWINQGAFTRSGLTHVSVPASIVIIDEEAFAYCANLQEVIL
jgi:hypothetical protein